MENTSTKLSLRSLLAILTTVFLLMFLRETSDTLAGDSTFNEMMDQVSGVEKKVAATSTRASVPISIITRSYTEKKTNCEADRFLVWQAHTSGLGSNLIIGASHALTLAAYTNRSFVLGKPHGNFPYMNRNPNSSIDFSWNEVLDMKKGIFSPCAEYFSKQSLSLSSQQEILENENRVIVVNFHNGPGGPGWWLGRLMNHNITGTKPFGYYLNDAVGMIYEIFGSLSHKAVIACVLREILLYQRFDIRHSLRIGKKYIGVHARGGDKMKEVKLEGESEFISALNEIKAAYGSMPSIYVSGDRQSLREETAKTFKDVFFLPEIITNPTLMGHDAYVCNFPCYFYDALFDIMMLAEADIILGTIGSGFSMLIMKFQRGSYGLQDSFAWHVGQEHPGLTEYVHSHLHLGSSSTRHSVFLDPRMDMGTKVGVLLSNDDAARNIVRLLSVHPWAFLILDECTEGNEATTLQLSSTHDCDLHGVEHLFVTPGIDTLNLHIEKINDLTRECVVRPLRVLVGTGHQGEEREYRDEIQIVNWNVHDNLISESLNVSLDMVNTRLISYISLLSMFQDSFGLPDITEDRLVLLKFLEGLG